MMMRQLEIFTGSSTPIISISTLSLRFTSTIRYKIPEFFLKVA